MPWQLCFPPQTEKELELWKGSDDGSICSWVAAHKELKMLLLLRDDDQKVVLVSRSKDPLVVDKKVGLVPRSKDPLVVDKKAVLVPTR